MKKQVILPTIVLLSVLLSVSSLWAQGASSKEKPVEVSLKWNKVQRAAGYEYKVIDQKNQVVLQERIQRSRVVVKLKPGQYFIQVAAISAGGNLGRWSTKKSFMVHPAGSEEERNARLQVIEDLSSELSQGGAESELGSIGLGKVNMFGGGIDFSSSSVTILYPFDKFVGGHIYFRYYKFFLDNLKPEVRLGFLTSIDSVVPDASLSFLKLYGYLSYPLGMFNNTFFLIPQVGTGIHYTNLAAYTFGEWYLYYGVSGGLEAVYQPVDSWRIFVRGEYTLFWTEEGFSGSVDMMIPSAGVAIRF